MQVHCTFDAGSMSDRCWFVDVHLYLASHETGKPGPIVWHRPRFEAVGKPPLLLRDYADFGPEFERDYPSAFVGSAKYLAAVAESVNDPKTPLEEHAKRNGLDAAFLKQWVKVIALESQKSSFDLPTRTPVPLTPLADKTPANPQRPTVNGWQKKGASLPTVVANASDQTLQIPGRRS